MGRKAHRFATWWCRADISKAVRKCHLCATRPSASAIESQIPSPPRFAQTVGTEARLSRDPRLLSAALVSNWNSFEARRCAAGGPSGWSRRVCNNWRTGKSTATLLAASVFTDAPSKHIPIYFPPRISFVRNAVESTKFMGHFCKIP